MIKFLHAADLHLDSPFDALPDALAAQRRSEQRGLLLRLAELCESEKPDIVLLAGDLLDSEHAYHETTELLQEVFSRIKADIFIAPGNHDYWSPRCPWSYMSLPENVHVFKSPVISPVRLHGCVVWGAGWQDKSCPGLLSGFSVPAEHASSINLMVMHGEVASQSAYNPLSEKDIAESGLDYLALGHIHRASGLKRSGDSHYAWPGCTEGRGFDECGEKGLYIGELGKGQCRLRFVPLGGRKYEVLEVNVEKSRDAAGTILGKLPEGAGRDIYRVILRGEVDAPPNLAAIEAQIAPRFFGLQLRDGTSLRRDIWAQAQEDTLKGLFLRRMKSRLDAARTEEELEKLMFAARCGLAALENREEPVR